MISNFILITLCCRTSFIVADTLAHGITGKYPGCSGKSNGNTVIITYMDGCITSTSKTLPPPRSLWTDPELF